MKIFDLLKKSKQTLKSAKDKDIIEADTLDELLNSPDGKDLRIKIT